MKKSLIVTILLIFCFAGDSRAGDKDWVLGVGVQTAFIGQKATNLIIDRYNETRPWLSNKMGRLRPASGMAYSFGWDAGTWAVELGYNQYRATTGSKGIAPGTGIEGSRDLKIKSNSIYLINHVDFASIFEETGDFGYGLSLGLNFGEGNYLTRVNNESFEEITNTQFSNLGAYFGFFYEHPLLGGDRDEGLCLRIAPFMHGLLGLGNRDMQGLKEELDPANANVALPGNERNSYHSHIGLNVKLVYRIAR